MIYEQHFLTTCIDQIGVYVSFGGAFFFSCPSAAPCCGWILLISFNNHIVHLRIDILLNYLNFGTFHLYC